MKLQDVLCLLFFSFSFSLDLSLLSPFLMTFFLQLSFPHLPYVLGAGWPAGWCPRTSSRASDTTASPRHHGGTWHRPHRRNLAPRQVGLRQPTGCPSPADRWYSDSQVIGTGKLHPPKPSFIFGFHGHPFEARPSTVSPKKL